MTFDIDQFLEDPSVASVVFYPQATPIPKVDPTYCKIIQFTMEDGTSIGGLFFINSPDAPSMLFFHGNGETAQDYSSFVGSYLKCKINVAIVDYRGYGFSTGRPTYKNLIQDSMPVYNAFHQWLEDQQMSQNIFVFGRSLGSVCAVEIGAHNPSSLLGIILESGICDTYKIMRTLFMLNVPGLTENNLKPWSNATKIPKIKKPVLILHGTRDHIVPYEHGTLAYSLLSDKVEKEFISIEGAGHNDILMYKHEYFPPICKFIQTYRK
ncbi:MAG: alpha/beta hydrolase [Promethearchaeota archaeon]